MEETGIRLTANDQFKRASTNWTQIGLLVAVTLHFGLFVLVRPFEAADLGVVVDELEAVTLPPEVKIPPPPEQIARPATPRVSSVDISEDITIAETSFEAFTTDNALPPPPETGSPSDRPSFIPYDTDPVLLNSAEILQILEREYPRPLKDAGIEGRVELWLFVDEQGAVTNFEVKVSSDNPLFDEAAGRVVPHMRFTPAKSRDKVIGVWVAQAVTFQVI